MDFIRITGDKGQYLPLLLLADPSEATIASYLDAGDLYAAEDAQGPVCVAVVLSLPNGCSELKNLAVREDRQRQGIGSRMVDFLFGQYPGPMQVGTSEKGVSFYQRLGFRVSHRVKGFFVDHYPEPIYEDGEQCVDMIYLIHPPRKA